MFKTILSQSHRDADSDSRVLPPYIRIPPESYCVSLLQCFASWLLTATASFRHCHLAFVPQAHLCLPFNVILSTLPSPFSLYYFILKPGMGIFSSFDFVTPPEEVSDPLSPRQQLHMFGTFASFKTRTNCETMSI